MKESTFTEEARLSAAQRRESAVVVRTSKDGTKEYKFPIPDKAHARQALRMIDQSDLTDSEKEKVRRRAKEVLGEKEYSRWASEDEIIADPTVFTDSVDSQEASVNINITTSQDAEEIAETISKAVTSALEAKGGIGSVGGHDPRADKRPLKNLVDSFGKWAKGKQSTCVRVLTTRHPELCAGRKGGCNALCAYMKDQFLGTTKWRKGNKKNLTKRALEGYVIVEGEEWILPEDIALDALALEADRNVNGPVERPDWFTDELAQELITMLEEDSQEATTELSYSEIFRRIDSLVRVDVQKRIKNKDEVFNGFSQSDYVYPSIDNYFSDYVVYRLSVTLENGELRRQLYKQMYRVDGENVNLEGDPTKVVYTYVSAESDVDEPVSEPIEEAELELRKLLDMVGEEVRKTHTPKSNSPADTDLYGWVSVDQTYDNYVIFTIHGGSETATYAQAYTIEDNKVSLSGDKLEVEMVYVPKNDATEADSESIVNMHVLVDNGNSGKVAVEVSPDMEILRGPKDLVGKYLPPIPENLQDSSESGEVGVCELTTQEATLAETSEEKLKTPNGAEVDAIVKIIRPGPGNSRDRFYYTAEAIRSTIDVFQGKKMYKNHLTRSQMRASEGQPRSVDDWVATVKEVWTDESGIAYGGILFVDESFYEKAKKGRDDLGVSVRGRVRARPGKIDGQAYNVVEGFTYGETVDFVTEAGAGGGIAAIAESDIMENDMDLENMTLDQLMTARPELFTEYADRLNAESSSTESETVVGVTADEVNTIVREALEAALPGIEARVKNGELSNNRLVMERTLRDSKLPKATQTRLAKEFHDATFDAVEATDDTPAKTSLEVYMEALESAIEEAREEIREISKSYTKVDDGGASEGSVEGEDETETETVSESETTLEVTKGVESALGIELFPKENK